MSADTKPDNPPVELGSPESELVERPFNESKPAAKPPKRRAHFTTGRKRDRSKRTADVIDAVITGELVPTPLRTDARKSLTAPANVTPSSSTRASSNTRGEMIRQAREAFQRHAALYVAKHAAIVERGLDMSHVDPRYLETSRRAAEFAIEHIGEGSDRIVDPKSDAKQLPAAPTIQIGIALGGMPPPRALPPSTDE